MKFAKIVFYVAGIYGLIVLTPMLLWETRVGVENPPAITHAEYFYGFLTLGIAWQVMFLVIASNPLRYRMAMLPSMIEKFGFGIAALMLYTQDRLPAPMLLGATIDQMLGVLFVVAFVVTRNSEQQS
jgi:hypothetical protein